MVWVRPGKLPAKVMVAPNSPRARAQQRTAPAAMPGLSVPAAAAFVEAVGGQVKPKFGWTDVARFSVLGVPAVNFGPGDPHLAHKQEEHVPLAQIESVERELRAWLEA